MNWLIWKISTLNQHRVDAIHLENILQGHTGKSNNSSLKNLPYQKNSLLYYVALCQWHVFYLFINIIHIFIFIVYTFVYYVTNVMRKKKKKTAVKT